METLLKSSVLFCSTLVIPFAMALDEHPDIKPLHVIPDINSVDLVSGKYYPQLPVLSVPAAPNLRLETIQQLVSKITGTEYGSSDTQVITDRTENYSLTYSGKTSESFECLADICTPARNTGSTLMGYMTPNPNPALPPHVFIYTQGKTGIKVRYEDESSFYSLGDPNSTTKTKGTWYASTIFFPSGETLTIDYDTTTVAPVTYHRPNTVTSDLGYEMSITYQSNDINGNWGSIATAEIVKTTNPTVILAKHTYSSTLDSVTDLQGRTWSYSGFSSTLGLYDYAGNFTLQLPEDSADSITVTSDNLSYGEAPYAEIHNNFVTDVARNGQSFSYIYTAKSGVGFNPKKQFSKVVVTGPENYTRTLDLDVFGAPNHRQLITGDTDSFGNTTQYFYTGYDVIDTVTYPENNQVKYTYDIFGNIDSKTIIPKPGSSLANIVIRADYDVYNCNFLQCFRPKTTTDANLKVTDYTFDPSHGSMLTKLEPADDNGRRLKTINTYDNTTVSGFFRLISTKVCSELVCGTGSIDEQITNYTYWNNTNLPKTVTSTNGAGTLSQVTTYTYDDSGRVTIEDGPVDGLDDATYYRYDAAGRKTWQIGPVNQQDKRVATRTTYRNQDDQIKKVEQGTLISGTDIYLVVFLTTDYSYNTKGLQTKAEVSSTNSVETVSQSTYDNRNRVECTVTRMNPATFTSMPTSACTLGAEGDFGPDRIVKNTYDTLSRITKTISGYGTTDAGIDIEIGYTDNGQVEWRKDGNGNLTSYSYDGVDRLDTTTFPDTSFEKNAYYPNSNLKTWRKRDGITLTHFYDDINLRTSTTVPNESNIVFVYDGLGRQDTVTRGSSVISYTYDGLSRLETTTTKGRTLTYAYNDAGLRSRLTHPDNFYVNYLYDDTGAMTSIIENDIKTLVDYLYNTKGQLTTISRNNGISSSLDFDELGRMKTYDHLTINNSTFGRNPASQIISRYVSNPSFQIGMPSVGSQSYEPNNLNQYTSVDGSSVGHDLNGNLTSYDGWIYDYNAHNRLISADKTGTALVLSYDPTGRLDSSTLNSSKTDFLYDGDELVAEYSGSTMTNRYVHGIAADDPLVWYTGSGTSNEIYLLANERGSIIAETNSSGIISSTHQYGPFGEPIDSSTARFRYTGQILLPGTELYHYKARVYNPKLGRFLQTDPIGYEDGMNWYAYVGNDPVNGVDPTGNAVFCLTPITAVVCGLAAAITSKKIYDWNKKIDKNVERAQQHSEIADKQADGIEAMVNQTGSPRDAEKAMENYAKDFKEGIGEVGELVTDSGKLVGNPGSTLIPTTAIDASLVVAGEVIEKVLPKKEKKIEKD